MLTNRQKESSKKAIQTTKIVQRLQKHGDGGLDLTASQIKAYDILLRKTLPDMRSDQVEINEGDNRSGDELWDAQASSMKGEMKEIYRRELSKRGIFLTFGKPQLEDVSVGS